MSLKGKLAAGIGLAPVLLLLLPAIPASAHGYVSSPPSRQALCAQGVVKNCGEIQYEPQSVEGPKGLRSCSGGNAQFAELDDESKGWPATRVDSSLTFNWVLTARHATSTWQYFIGGTKVAEFNDGGKIPGATVSHSVNLGSFSGRQKILAVWNIADTANAFYNCIDVDINGGGGTPPTTTTAPPTTTTTPPPTTTTTVPTTTTAVPGGTAWTAGNAYKAGDVVTYDGASYKCSQAHTALPGWEPSTTPALWQKV
ncbi:lytic polysaccharide monooxygenase [Kutzneria viridogrisea]|uniref:Chitin-binding protein n=1 Tax=Kutzneria viridogrisea TaxID=47990 RepID=A0ABR6BM97_9PSEU|nr:chitin-binding protein [Kutzneria viridogrisea]